MDNSVGMGRSTLSISGLLLSSLFTAAHAQGDRVIAFRATAGSADRILKDIGVAAGISLRATPTTARDILLISVKDVPLSVLMKRIADADNATWESEGDGFRLNRTTLQQRADVDTERQNLAARYQEGLKKIAAEAAALNPLTDSSAKGLVQRAKDANAQSQSGQGWAMVSQITAQAPAGRLLVRLLATLSGDMLASIPENGRVVFSDSPNGMQRRLPGSANAALQLYVREQGLMASAAGPDSEPFNGGYVDTRTLTSALKAPPAKVIIAATRRPLEGSINCSLEILDAQDHVLGTANHSIGASTFEGVMPGQGVKRVDGEKPIAFSPDSRALRSIFKNFGGMANLTTQSLSPELRKKLADPLANEPLGYATSEALMAYADAQGANLVGVLTDASAMMLFPFSGDDMLPSQIPSMLKAAEERADVRDGWISVVPITPASTRAHRTDRAALTRLLQTLLAKGGLRIDDAAAYAVACPGISIDILAMLTCAVLDSSAILLFEKQNSMNALRFYGSMTAGQRQAAGADQPIAFSSLTLAQKDSLLEMVFGADSSLNSIKEMVMEEGQTPIFPTRECTEVLPNGIPSSGRFTVKQSSEYVVLAVRESGVQMGDSGMSAYELAWRFFAQEHPESQGSWATEPRNRISLDSLRPGTRSTIALHFDLTTQIGFDQQLRQMSSSGKTVAFADLADEFKKQFQKTHDSYKGMNFGSPPGGGSPPPPPRP